MVTAVRWRRTLQVGTHGAKERARDGWAGRARKRHAAVLEEPRSRYSHPAPWEPCLQRRAATGWRRSLGGAPAERGHGGHKHFGHVARAAQHDPAVQQPGCRRAVGRHESPRSKNRRRRAGAPRGSAVILSLEGRRQAGRGEGCRPAPIRCQSSQHQRKRHVQQPSQVRLTCSPPRHCRRAAPAAGPTGGTAGAPQPDGVAGCRVHGS